MFKLKKVNKLYKLKIPLGIAAEILFSALHWAWRKKIAAYSPTQMERQKTSAAYPISSFGLMSFPLR